MCAEWLVKLHVARDLRRRGKSRVERRYCSRRLGCCYILATSDVGVSDRSRLGSAGHTHHSAHCWGDSDDRSRWKSGNLSNGLGGDGTVELGIEKENLR